MILIILARKIKEILDRHNGFLFFMEPIPYYFEWHTAFKEKGTLDTLYCSNSIGNMDSKICWQKFSHRCHFVQICLQQEIKIEKKSTIYMYSQTVLRDHLWDKEKKMWYFKTRLPLLKVISKKRFNLYDIFYDTTRKSDLLIHVTA
jgi:hypothetical protein